MKKQLFSLKDLKKYKIHKILTKKLVKVEEQNMVYEDDAFITYTKFIALSNL